MSRTVNALHTKKKKKKKKSLVSFTVPHHEPGALADVLDCFKRCALNLTSINSVPSHFAPFQYLFIVEFEGSKFDGPIDSVKNVLEGVDKAAREWRFLGSWERRGEAQERGCIVTPPSLGTTKRRLHQNVAMCVLSHSTEELCFSEAQ